MNPTTPTTQQLFNGAYWQSQAPAVQALQALSGTARETQAASLAAAGYLIDVEIMAWGWDAWTAMLMRQKLNEPWVPGALSGQESDYALPGYPPEPGQLPWPATMPAGWVPVSTSPGSYPPFTPPAAPVTTPAITDPVGGQSLGNIYLTVSGDNSPAGTRFTDSRGTFVKQVTATPFGSSAYWLKVA